jgi:hypothetical protein
VGGSSTRLPNSVKILRPLVDGLNFDLVLTKLIAFLTLSTHKCHK